MSEKLDLTRRLSANFTLAELVVSQTAIRFGLDNTPPPEAIAALERLTTNILQPVRDRFGPVHMLSGYRSELVNRRCGGARHSQHKEGEAGDLRVPGFTNLAVCEWIRDNLPFDQLIYEFGERGWVHCSFSIDRLRRQTLTARRVHGRTEYLPGFVT